MSITRRALVFLSLAIPIFLLSELTAQSASMITAEKGWATSNHHLFWTSDDGDHWKDITPPTAIGELLGDVFLDASRGWVLLSSDDPDRNLLTFDLAHTTNSGQTWTTARVKVPSQKPDELDGVAWLSFVDENHGWIVLRAKSSSAFSWGLLLATDDGGATWNELPQAPIAGRPVFSDALDGWITGNAGPGGVYSTHDGGKSWQSDGPSLADLPPSLPTRASYGDVKFFDSKHGALPVWLRAANDAEEPRGTALVLYVTSDSGRTWKQDKTLTDHDAFSKSGAALSRIGAAALVGESFPPALITAFNDRAHKSRVTIKTLVSSGGAASDAVPSVGSDGVLWRQGDDVSALSFITFMHGWATTNLGDLFETKDGGKSWKDISPIPVLRPAMVPNAGGKAVKAREIGPGPSLLPPSPQQGLNYTEGLGFDEHSVASVATMGTWFSMSPFFEAGVYLGGANYCYHTSTGCLRYDPNLTSLWVQQIEGQGWGFLPIWVGPQAPCVNATGFNQFTSANASAQGKSNADSAAAAMATLGLQNTVVFYDMENYTSSPGDSCSLAVRAFLQAWVAEMNSDGYQTTAVYGNPGPAQNDFSQIKGLTQVWITATPASGYPPRVTIWGLGNGSYALQDGLWSTNQRAHQFLIDVGSAGAGFVTYGGVTTGLSIDYDMANLLLPGAQEAKPYIWFGSNIATPAGTEWGYGVGVNDMTSYTNPEFVSDGSIGEAMGWWFTEACGPAFNCWYDFINASGSVSTFSDPSGTIWTDAAAINDASQVVGYYCYGVQNNGSLECYNIPYGTIFYESGFSGSLATNSFSNISLTTAGYTFLYGINDDSQIVGGLTIGATLNPTTLFIYQNGNMTPLYIECGGGLDVGSIAGINGYSQIVGTYGENEGGYGFVYDYDGATQSGTCIPVDLPNNSRAYAINNQGQVLGSSASGQWLLQNGVFYAIPEIFENQNITGINDAGQILGSYSGGTCGVDACAFVLNPE